jgi:lysophospholipase L1-like esterase
VFAPAAAAQAPVGAPPAAATAQAPVETAAQAPLDLAQWEKEIRAFEDEDRRSPPPAGAVLFVGSSSIRLWTTLRADFPGQSVLNRGFGGSQIREVTAFVPRIVLPYEPRLIVFYCGSNDIASGARTAVEVLDDYRAFVRAVHGSLPETRILFVSIAPNPARWHLRQAFRKANALIEAYTGTDPRLGYIDVWTQMIGVNGRPRPDLFVDDRLHMNEKGYAIWERVIGEKLKVENGKTKK